MKSIGLPFIIDAAKAFFEVFRRFPLTVLSAAGFVAVAAFYHGYLAILVSTGIGIPLFILSSLVQESLPSLKPFGKWAPSIAAILLLVSFGIGVHISFGEEVYNTIYLRLGMILLAIHLAIAFLPPLLANLSPSSIWEYNKALLSHFIVSAFYSAVSYIGTALAIASINLLFGARIDEDNFFRLWLFFAFFFNTALFLGAVPRMPDLEPDTIAVPSWIQFLCKFILLPLVVLYFGILYVYLGKIGLSLSWPDGMVGYPIFVLAVIGGLTALLMWPLAGETEGVVWARTFWRWYFPLLVPLSIILILAMLKRIDAYGFTELRVAGLVLAVWLAGISIFFSFKRNADFRPIPISLCLIALLCLFGPLSPRAISQKSQWNRLESLLLEGGWLKENELVSIPRSISPESYEQLRSTIRYLRSYYGPDRFRNWANQLPDKYNQSMATLDKESLPSYQLDAAIVEFLGATPDLSSHESRYFNFNRKQDSPYEFHNATRFYTHQIHGYAAQTGLTIDFGEEAIQLTLVNGGRALAIRTEDGRVIDQIDFDDWMNARNFEARPASPNRHLNLNSSELAFELDLGSGRGALHLVFDNAHMTRDESGWSLGHGRLLVFTP